MMLTDDPIIRCSSCGMEHRINKDMLDPDTFFIGEGGMGEQYEHDFVFEGDCENCGRRMWFKLYAIEYPVGAWDSQFKESEGCDVLYEPAIEMEYLPEPALSIYEQILYDPTSVYNLDPWGFEGFVADIFRQHGYDVDVTQRTRDGGKDIVASFEKGGILYNTYFECKQYAPNRPVGAKYVRELFGKMNMEHIDKGVIVTTSYFTRDAIREAEETNGRIQLIDFKKLQQLMQKRS